MKHPRCVNRTCIPWSTICPTDTRFFVIVRHGSGELLRHFRSEAKCHLLLRLLLVAPVFLGLRTTLYGSSYGLTLWCQRTTVLPILVWSSSSSLLLFSSRRLPPFRLFWILRRSAIATGFLVPFIRIQIQFSPNRCASSNTRSPCGLSCHNTSIP